MDPNEVEFIGENRRIGIIPNFNLGTIHLLSGSVGPFKAGATLNVPLWLAVSLKQQQKCRIMCPDWMKLENLETVRENEKLSRTFTKMANNHYMDEAHILMDIASDDIPGVDSVRTAIKDIWDIRMSKLRTSLDELIKEKSGVHAILNNLTVMELNSIRPLLPHTMDQLFRIRMMTVNK